MNELSLARWQFAITTVYHFFFVPITIGLSLLVAGLQTAWVRTRVDRYLALTKFFGKLFLINFAMGVVTGIVQEFQFGMSWSDYSRFVGDVFGAPLALEGLLAFFLESTFLGLWIFGWDRLPRRVHLACIWIAAIGTVLSAYFILAANSFMQNPVGFVFNAERGRAELVDIVAVLTNPVVLVTFPHQIFACLMVGGALMAGIAGWHLLRSTAAPVQEQQPECEDEHEPIDEPRTWRTALRIGAVVLLLSGAGVLVSGDLQGKVMTQVQPMKMAAAEALYTTEQPASFSVITIGTLDGKHELFSLKIPYLLSLLGTGDPNGEVKGIDELQATYEAMYGPGSYAPYVPTTYWTFRIMITTGLLAMAGGLLLLWWTRRDRVPRGRLWLIMVAVLPFLPLLGNTFGWIFTETGRQPWLVFGLLPTAAGVSPGTTLAEVITSLSVFTLLYGVLAVIEGRLLLTYIRAGLPELHPTGEPDDPDHPTTRATTRRPRCRSPTDPSEDTAMELTTVWFVLIAFLWIGYFVLEGFDFGVGMIMPVLGRPSTAASSGDAERRTVINTIGPHWDGNEVWLIVAGGAMFAAFPDWYATMFSGFYLPLLAVLVALILRAVALEYRGKRRELAWRRRWDRCIVVGSVVPALVWGIAFGNLVAGVPIDADGEYVGGLVTLLGPFPVLVGLVTLVLFATHGAVFVALKTDGVIRVRARALAGRLGIAAAALTAVALLWLVLRDDSRGPLTAMIMMAVAVLVLAALVGAMIANATGREGWAFVQTTVATAGLFVLVFVSLFPALMPSSLDPAWSLTTTNASATAYTLRIMTIAAAVCTPVVLLYQGWTYWVFRRRITVAQIRDDVLLPAGSGR